ncbi:MAG: hypothetical protein ACSHYA_08275 [Opitutaceae bacterium]
MQRILRYFSFLTLGIALTATAKDVSIRLNPTANSPIIKRVSETDPIVKKATTITNSALAKQGWMRSSKTLLMDGYLSADKLSKNFEIEINAKVYAENTLKGKPLTTIQANDPIELLEVDDRWAIIRIKKAMPVYFQLGEQRDPLPIYVPSMTNNPIQVDTTKFNPNLSVGITRPEALPPENVVWVGGSKAINYTPPEPTQASALSSTLVQNRSAPARTTIKAEPDGRIYRLTGQLIRAINSEAPRYSLHLENAAGNRIAYVDASQMYIEDIRPYLNKTVFIHGEAHALEAGSQSIVIVARTIRVGE